MKFLEAATRNLFFTGKGGVGKTSVACATAVRLADQGRRVLLVSTDPASNLDEVLQVSLTNRPQPIPELPNLYAVNLDPEAAATEYRERMVGPYRGLLPPATIASMEEQFSGACTLEIAAFDEFSRLLGDPQATTEFDHVVFDTAPTGHTLRLLTLPSAWSGFMETNTTGTSCLGPLAGLQAQQQLYQTTAQVLSDPRLTTLVIVTRPESSALNEAARASDELRVLGVGNQHLVINGVFQAQDQEDVVAAAMEDRTKRALAQIPAGIARLPRTVIPLASYGILGLHALRTLGQVNRELPVKRIDGSAPHCRAISDLIDDFAAQGRGVILTMGKGGVGKTTVAAAIALSLADRGLPVHLTTTDPAAHLIAALGDAALPNLTVSRIDPAEETARYAAEVMRTAGANLDAAGQALLAEDLRSPCTEEIAVFRAFAQSVDRGHDQFVILDTAPTGHTILLLDAALAYHREVTRQSAQMPAAVEQLLPRLRNPEFTRVLIVTLPEATPVHEAAALQQDLRRAEIEPYAWVINQSLSPLSLTDPTLCGRQTHELPYLREVTDQLAQRTVLLAWQPVPPAGQAGLRRLVQPR